jgi:hypothetical protein
LGLPRDEALGAADVRAERFAERNFGKVDAALGLVDELGEYLCGLRPLERKAAHRIDASIDQRCSAQPNAAHSSPQ